MKKISIMLLLAMITFSCSNYLDEEIVGTVTYDYYNTEAGVEDLVDGIYGDGLRWMFNGEQSFTLFNYGVDEYHQASDGQNKYFDGYTNQLNPSSATAYIHDMWTTYYRVINMANLALDNIGAIDATVSSNTIYKTEQFKQQRLGEVHFLRGFFYFMLVQQFGSVPLTLDGVIGVRTEFTRAPVADIYKQIIKDLRFAESVLPLAKDQQYGRISKGAAQHYLAKVYLTRGSAVAESAIRGTQPTDIDSAAYWADAVIQSNQYKLVDNYADLWDVSKDVNTETILVAAFNNNALLLNGSGNRTHLYYGMVYDNKPGMQRDITYGRPFRRLMLTDYGMDVFDRKNDSRFYKSVRTAYLSNNASTIPRWTSTNAPSGDLVGQPRFKVGDTAIFITMDKNVSAAAIASKYYTWIPRNKFTNQEFPALVKFIDPTRLDISTETASRDGYYARLAETYLIGAEAYGRKANYTKALGYINALRQRAAYKVGEVKPNHFWKTEGGTAGDVNSTYAEIEVTESDFDPANTDAAHLAREQYPVSATTKEQQFIHFILNERTRELAGEFQRWTDLVRTETFYERVKQFNPDAAPNIQPYHKLRPIPQDHIDRLWRDGKPLTDPEQKEAEQNEGYY